MIRYLARQPLLFCFWSPNSDRSRVLAIRKVLASSSAFHAKFGASNVQTPTPSEDRYRNHISVTTVTPRSTSQPSAQLCIKMSPNGHLPFSTRLLALSDRQRSRDLAHRCVVSLPSARGLHKSTACLALS